MTVSPRAPLAELLTTRELIVVGGAGGVGKTTISAALGIAAARHAPGDVLVLTIDPARRLATALGVDLEGGEPVALDLPRTNGTLHTAMLDPGRAWDELVAGEAPDPETADRLMANAVFRRIADSFVHGNDYAALNWLSDALESGRYRLVIVDTPPSQSALEFFDASGRVVEFFGSPLLGWLTNTDPASVVGTAAAKTFASIADRILGSGFFQDVVEFFQLMHGIVPAMIERTSAVTSRIAGDDAAFVAVTGPDDEMVGRIDGYRAELGERGIDIDATIVNGVEPAAFWDLRALDVARRVAAGERSPFPKGRTALLAPGADYVIERCEVARRQEAALDRLGGGAAHAIPRFVHSPSGVPALTGLADRLWESTGGRP